MSVNLILTFEKHLAEWLILVYDEYEVAEKRQVQPSEIFAALRSRLSDDILKWIAWGLEHGIVREVGGSFKAAGNGPYKWFSRRTAPQGWPIHPNWEEFVHAAYFGRLSRACEDEEVTIGFEDRRMDLTVYREGRLYWYIEVKEKAEIASRLPDDLRLVSRIPWDRSSRIPRNDPKRDAKAKLKYLEGFQPEAFSVVAIDFEEHFQVVSTKPRLTLESTAAPYRLPTSP